MNDDVLPKKALGQHWLNDSTSLEAMCDAAEVKDTDIILEIGPGLGTLTKYLTKKSKSVIAVEYDKILAANLSRKVQADNLTVIQSDILEYDFSSIKGDYKVVANIPYYITSHLLRILSELKNPPKRAVLLIQKEVAQRVNAKPGDMSILSVTAQYYWDVSLGREVLAELFTPPPKVDSQILILIKRGKPLFADIVAADFFRLIKAGFAQKRKTLLNTISNGLHIDRDIFTAAAQSVEIDPNRRAQTLSLDEWHNLYISLNT